jgi:hypothetical protein
MEKVNSLQSPLGKIKIKVNNIETYYICKELNKIEMSINDKNLIFFKVDERYALIVDIIDENIKHINSIECFLDKLNDTISGYAETGENLELISFELDKIKLSIGVELIENATYIYNDNGIKIEFYNINNRNKFVFLLAWDTINDYEKESIYTWFAADPSLLEKKE